MSETYKVTDAAKRMGIAPETLRTMLVRKELPFGATHRMPSGRRIYIIPREAFDRFMTGERGNT